MADVTNAPRASDVLSVRSRISWGAIVAGAMVALSIYMVLSLLGIALGAEVAWRRGVEEGLGTGAAIYSVFTLLVSMFFGGWATSRLAVGETKLEAVLYGLILWGTLFMGLIWLLSVGIRTGFGAMVGMASGAYTVSSDVAGQGRGDAGGRNLVDAVRQRYDTELGGARFVDDLKKAGLSDEQAQKVQQEIHGRIDRLRQDPSALPEVARDVAQQPEVQQAATRAANTARQATWWTLLGVIVSMATVILGSLTGSGEILQPVPILGVRRVRSTTVNP